MFYVVFLERAFAGLESTAREERLRGSAREVEVRQRERWSAGVVVARRRAQRTRGFFLVGAEAKKESRVHVTDFLVVCSVPLDSSCMQSPRNTLVSMPNHMPSNKNSGSRIPPKWIHIISHSP